MNYAEAMLYLQSAPGVHRVKATALGATLCLRWEDVLIQERSPHCDCEIDDVSPEFMLAHWEPVPVTTTTSAPAPHLVRIRPGAQFRTKRGNIATVTMVDGQHKTAWVRFPSNPREHLPIDFDGLLERAVEWL